MDELKEAGIEVIFVTISAPKNSEDKILHGVRGLFAEYERAKIAERFRLGKLRKIKNGELLVSEPLYGYKYIPRTENIAGHYEIDEYESGIIKQIFNFIANDKMTLRGVVKKLQELNIKPRKSKRGVWNVSTIRSQVINRAYIGEAHWGSSYAVVPENPINIEKYRKVKKSSRKIKAVEDWYIIPVPPIIDKDVFERANLQLKDNFKLCQRNKKNEYLLGSRIYCTCGHRRNGEGIKNGKHLYYRCSSRVHSFPHKTTCIEKGIDARIADKLIFDKIAEIMSSPELMQKQLKRWLSTKEVKKESDTLDIPNIEKQIKKLKEEEDRYNKAYGAGVMSIDKLKEYTSTIKEQISDLKSKIDIYNDESKEISLNLPKEDEMLSYSIEATKMLKNLDFAQKRDIVLNTVEKVTASQEKLTVIGYLPITSSSNYEYKSISRHRRPPKRG